MTRAYTLNQITLMTEIQNMEHMTRDQINQLISDYKRFKGVDDNSFNKVVETFLNANKGYIYIIKSAHLLENIDIGEAKDMFFEALDRAIKTYDSTYERMKFSTYLMFSIKNILSQKFQKKSRNYNDYIEGKRSNVDVLDISLAEGLLINSSDSDDYIEIFDDLTYRSNVENEKEKKKIEDALIVIDGIKEALEIYRNKNKERGEIVDMYYMFYIDPLTKTVDEIVEEFLKKYPTRANAVNKYKVKMEKIKKIEGRELVLRLKDIGLLFGRSGQQVTNNINTLNRFIIPFLTQQNKYKEYLPNTGLAR